MSAKSDAKYLNNAVTLVADWYKIEFMPFPVLCQFKKM